MKGGAPAGLMGSLDSLKRYFSIIQSRVVVLFASGGCVARDMSLLTKYSNMGQAESMIVTGGTTLPIGNWLIIVVMSNESLMSSVCVLRGK